MSELRGPYRQQDFESDRSRICVSPYRYISVFLFNVTVRVYLK